MSLDNRSRHRPQVERETVMIDRLDLIGWIHDAAHLLQGLDGVLALISDGADNLQEMRGVARSQLTLLKEMLNNLGCVGRMASPAPPTFDLNAVVNSCIHTLRNDEQSSGVTIVTRLSQRPLRVVGDRTACRRIVLNLVRNAIEATAGGRVVVRTRRAGVYAEMQVADTGGGIAGPLVGSILREPVTTKANGSGRGLIAVRRLVVQQGGEISFLNQPGVGATFTARFQRSVRHS